MLYVSYGFVPKAFKPFLKKRAHDYTLYEAENQLKAYQTSQTSSFFEMPKLEIKQIKAGRNETLLTLNLKSNEMQADTFSLESYLEEYFLSNYMDFSDFEELRQDLSESSGPEIKMPENKAEKKWLPVRKQKAADSSVAPDLTVMASKEYDFTQDFTEEEWALAESEAEETESFSNEDGSAAEREEEAISKAGEQEKKYIPQQEEGYSSNEMEPDLFKKEMLRTIQQKVAGWQAVLADPQQNIFEKQLAQFQLGREQEKLQLLEGVLLSHERSLRYFQTEKEAEAALRLEETLTIVRLEKEKEYEAILQGIEDRAKAQYAEERRVFQQRLEAEKQAQQSIIERNYQQALAQLEDRLNEKERIKKEELAEKGNVFLEQEYAKRKRELEDAINQERVRVTATLQAEMLAETQQTKEALLAKQKAILANFEEETAAQLERHQKEWYAAFEAMEREIQQTEKSKQHRIKAETYRLRAQEQLEATLREKDLQIAALRAEVDKVEKEYQLFMAKERAEKERKEATLETYAKEKEELNHSFKTFLEVNSQKQKAGMLLSASSFLIMVIVLLTTLL